MKLSDSRRLSTATQSAVVLRLLIAVFVLPASHAAGATLGVDVSGNDGLISWGLVKSPGQKNFALVRATQGRPGDGWVYKDGHVDENVPNAKANGIIVGVYHFALPLENPGASGARSEAQNFVNVASQYTGNGFLPIALDIEDDPYFTGNPSDVCVSPDSRAHPTDWGGGVVTYSCDLTAKLTAQQLSEWIQAWITEVQNGTHSPVMLYMTRYYARYLKNETVLAALPLWIVSSDASPDPLDRAQMGDLGPWSDWTFQQYNWHGRVAGIRSGTGDVDLDAFNGDPATLAAFASSGGGTSPSIDTFLVPSSATIGTAIRIDYTVADQGGPGLGQVQLRRCDSNDCGANDPAWKAIGSQAASGTGVVDGVFYDTPSTIGTYWYGLQVCDISGSSSGCIDERQAAKGPKQVTVAELCTSFSLSVSSPRQVLSDAGSRLIAITGSPNGCMGGSWTASGNGSWITVSPTSGTGPGTATVSWEQNPSTLPRTGNAAIAGNTLTINQYGAPIAISGEFISEVIGAEFGQSVAMSSDGSTLLVGAYGTNGIAYVFTRNGSDWTKTQLTSPDWALSDQFGWSVALSADGNIALVGAPSKVVNGTSNRGAVYGFVRVPGTNTCNQLPRLTGDEGFAEHFGFSIGLSGDGSVAIVGAYNRILNGNTQQGVAYLFVRSGMTWSSPQLLTASDAAARDQFGWSVALSGDGTTALVGAANKTVNSNGQQGAAYIFATSGGSGWSQQKILTATGGTAGDHFGWSVALSDNGKTAIVGAYNKTVNGNSQQGAAYFFANNGDGWSQLPMISASDGEGAAHFGASVALSGDGRTAIVGSYSKTVNGNDQQGAAYPFTTNGATTLAQPKLTASDGATGDLFGTSVALNGNGSAALTGAPGKTVNGNANQGATYLTVLNVTQLPTLTPTPTTSFTPTKSFTPTRTDTPSATPTATSNPTATFSPSPTLTIPAPPSRTTTRTSTATPTQTYTMTPSPTGTATPTATPVLTNSPTATGTALPTTTLRPTATAPPGVSACCQCPASCSAPTDGSCGECTMVAGAGCRGGVLCEVFTPTPNPKVTPTATRIPGASDCCQCTNFCAMPIVGTCGGCTVVFSASCTEGSLCVSQAVPTPTASPSPSAFPSPPPAACVGDCGGDGEVTVDEIIIMVNVALGVSQVSACTAGDSSVDDKITVDEIIGAVNKALNGCGA